MSKNDPSQFRDQVEERVAHVDSLHDWSSVPSHLRGNARRFTLSCARANAILELADLESALVNAHIVSLDPNLEELIRDVNDELMESSLEWMNACLHHEDRQGITYDHLLDFKDVKRRQRIIGRETLSTTEIALGMHMFLMAAAVIGLEESPYISIRHAKKKKGSTARSTEEIDEIVKDIGSAEFNDVLAEIENRTESDPPTSVFIAVDCEAKTIHWRTKSGKESRITFKSLKRSLRKKAKKTAAHGSNT